MASRLVHVAVLSSSLALLLALLLVTVTVFEAPTSSPRYPKQHLLVRPKHPQTQQQRDLVAKKDDLEVESAEEKQNQQHLAGAKKEDLETSEVEFAEEKQHQQQLPRRRWLSAMAMAAAAGSQLKTWPDLVGLNAEEAKKKILEEHPNLQVLVVPAGAMVTQDYRPQRVRIFKDANQKVTAAPRVG